MSNTAGNLYIMTSLYNRLEKADIFEKKENEEALTVNIVARSPKGHPVISVDFKVVVPPASTKELWIVQAGSYDQIVATIYPDHYVMEGHLFELMTEVLEEVLVNLGAASRDTIGAVNRYKNGVRQSIFEPHPTYYVPQPDEPSPFGSDVSNGKDNPWIVWCRDREGYDEQRDGSPTILREMLMERLEKENYRMIDLVEMEEPPVTCPNGRDVSLGWVIFTRALLGGFAIQTIHLRGHVKVKHMLLKQQQLNGE